jgi:hypothetical protein
MPDLFQKAAELPWAALVPVGALFVIGLILWVAGRPVLRPVFIVGGLMAGGLAGLDVGMTSLVAGLGIPWWGWGVAGAVVAALLAALAYRLLLVVAVGGLLGALAPLLVWTAVELNLIRIEGIAAPPVQEVLAQSPVRETEAPQATAPLEERPLPASVPQPAGGDQVAPGTELAQDAAPAEAVAGNASQTEAPAVAIAEWRHWVADTYGFVARRAGAAWDQSAAPMRWMLAAAAAVGVLLGLIVGATAPSFSASVVTALGGALLLIGAGCTVAARLHLPPALLPQSAVAWLAWWVVAAVIGLGLQWIFRPKPADK